MKTRRLLSLLLTVVMVLTVLPLAVFAWEAQSAVNLRVRINGRFLIINQFKLQTKNIGPIKSVSN